MGRQVFQIRRQGAENDGHAGFFSRLCHFFEHEAVHFKGRFFSCLPRLVLKRIISFEQAEFPAPQFKPQARADILRRHLIISAQDHKQVGAVVQDFL